MLFRAADLIARLYGADEAAVIEALKIIRAQSTTSLPFVLDAIHRPKENAARPIFYNPSKEVDVWSVGEENLKLVAIQIKRRTEVRSALNLICNLSDAQLEKLAGFITGEPETASHADATDKPYTKPFVPVAMSWREQREIMLGTGN